MFRAIKISNNLNYFYLTQSTATRIVWDMLSLLRYIYMVLQRILSSTKRWDPHILFLSRWIRVLYVRETKFHASIYLSIHMAMHFCSELSRDVPGLLMHFLKHFSDIFVSSSWAFAIAICCFTWSINSSFCTPLREPVVSESILVVARNFQNMQFYRYYPICNKLAGDLSQSKITSNFIKKNGQRQIFNLSSQPRKAQTALASY